MSDETKTPRTDEAIAVKMHQELKRRARENSAKYTWRGDIGAMFELIHIVRIMDAQAEDTELTAAQEAHKSDVRFFTKELGGRIQEATELRKRIAELEQDRERLDNALKLGLVTFEKVILTEKGPMPHISILQKRCELDAAIATTNKPDSESGA